MNILRFILFIFLIVIIFYLNKDEKFSEDIKFNDMFKNLEFVIREDLTKPYIYNLSDLRSEYLYNYLFNCSKNSNLAENMDLNLNDYLIKICFVEDNNLVDPIISNANDLLLNYYNCDTLVGKYSYISTFVSLYKNFLKLKFKDDILKYINYKPKFLDNYIIFDSIVDIIIDVQDEFNTENIKDATLKLLNKKNILSYLTENDYDDYDILFESIDQAIIYKLNVHFNLMYDTILTFTLDEVNNLFYSGRKNNFSYNMDFC